MNLVYLFTLPELITLENLSDIDLKGLAEWSDEVPDLFLLLIGRDPSTCSWAVYTDGNHPPAFICHWSEAAARLDALTALVQASSDPGSQALAQRLEPIQSMLAQQKNTYLVLHLAELLHGRHGRRYQSKAYKDEMASWAAAARALADELDSATADAAISARQPRLSKLAARCGEQLGWWDPRVEEGYWLDGEHPDETPDFLREFDDSTVKGNRLNFDSKLGAYEVQGTTPEGATRYGIVTAYGRWLLPWGDRQPLSNRYDDHAKRSWIVLVRRLERAPKRGPKKRTQSEKMVYGLLDANGLEVLPMAYASISTHGDKLLSFQTLEDGDAGREVYHLMRIDIGQVLEGDFDDTVHARDDGSIQVGFADGGVGAHRGLIDFEGKALTEFAFENFSPFHKKHGVAAVWRGGKVGLINRQGKVILPIEYERLGMKLSDGPPHFHGDATLIFTAKHGADGEVVHRSERVGVANKTGRVIVPPTWEPWHLQWAFDKDGRMLVHRDEVLYHLYADGTISGPQGSRQDVIDEVVADLRGRLLPSQERKVHASSLAAQVDRDACNQLIQLLCRSNVEACQTLQVRLAECLDECAATTPDSEDDDDSEDDPKLYVAAGDQPATPFFRPLAYALRDEGIWMHLDWKAVDEVANAHAHMPDVAALAHFRWDGMAHGEDISDAFAALDEHLSQHGWRLVSYQTDGDYYMIGVVAADALANVIMLAQSLGVPIHPIHQNAI